MRSYLFALVVFSFNILCWIYSAMDPLNSGTMIGYDMELINSTEIINGSHEFGIIDVAVEGYNLLNFVAVTFWRCSVGFPQLLSNFGLNGNWNTALTAIVWLIYGVGIFQLVFNRGMKNNE